MQRLDGWILDFFPSSIGSKAVCERRPSWSLTCILVFNTSVGCSMTADRTPENPPETKLATE